MELIYLSNRSCYKGKRKLYSRNRKILVQNFEQLSWQGNNVPKYFHIKHQWKSVIEMVCHTGFCCFFLPVNINLNLYLSFVLVVSFSFFLFFFSIRYLFSTTLTVKSLAKSFLLSLPMRSHYFPMKNEDIHSVSDSCSSRILSL